MLLPRERRYTIEDIYNLPEGSRAELIDGQIYDMAPPTRSHQRIVGEIYFRISQYIKEHAGSCEVDVSPFAVFLNEDKSRYVEPDISVICDRNKLDDRGCHGAPDWIIEVVSPSSRKMDYYTKLVIYKDAGVRLYWLVDGEKRAIVVYDLEHEAVPVIFSFDDMIPVGIYKDFIMDFSTMDIGE